MNIQVFIIQIEIVNDYEIWEKSTQLFTNIKEAREVLAKEVAKAKEWAQDGDSFVINPTDTGVEIYEDGYEAQTHYYVSLAETTLHDNTPSWILQASVENQAIEEIRALLAKTPNNEWHFGDDYCDEDGGGDRPFVMSDSVNQDGCVYEIAIDAIGIDKNNAIVAVYHTSNPDEIGAEEYDDCFIPLVLPQYYQNVARALHDAIENK